MTEAEWLKCQDPLRMLAHLWPDPDGRKTLLLTAAVCRRIWGRLPASGRAWVGAVEEAAEGMRDPDLYTEDWVELESFLEKGTDERYAVLQIAGWYWRVREAMPRGDENWEFERAEQASLVREIFGNPFRAIVFDPSWRTPTVVGLAHGIYDLQAFERMPILGDALEDAGCTDEAILSHCRGPDVHERGCWVLDAILGRE
jgi:hypothetical protein